MYFQDNSVTLESCLRFILTLCHVQSYSDDLPDVFWSQCWGQLYKMLCDRHRTHCDTYTGSLTEADGDKQASQEKTLDYQPSHEHTHRNIDDILTGHGQWASARKFVPSTPSDDTAVLMRKILGLMLTRCSAQVSSKFVQEIKSSIVSITNVHVPGILNVL